MAQPKYQPVDLIPLEYLDLGAASDASSTTSEIFNGIRKFNDVAEDNETFENDGTFQDELVNFKTRLRRSSYICWVIVALCLLLWAGALAAYASTNSRARAVQTWKGPATNTKSLGDRNVTFNHYDPKNQNVSFESYRAGQFFPTFTPIRWLTSKQFPTSVTAATRGFYLTKRDTRYLVHQVGTEYEHVLLDSIQFNYANEFHYAQHLELNPNTAVDHKNAWHLFRSNVIPQWRHSLFANYWLWNPATGTIVPIEPKDELSQGLRFLHFAKFSPNGDFVVFGYNHDLYLMEISSAEVTRITVTGSSQISNGKPDWVYEEEVYPSESMVWWSPDLRNLIYSEINDTSVREYNIDYYIKNPSEGAMSYEDLEKLQKRDQYPKHSRVKYPKPGSPNPTAKLFCYNTESKQSTLLTEKKHNIVGEEFLIYDVAWVDYENAIIKLADRTSTVAVKSLFRPSSGLSHLSTVNASSYGGWIEKAEPITPVMRDGKSGYLDRIVIDQKTHLVYYDLPAAKDYAKDLGKVSYESPFAYDATEDCVYGLFGTNLEVSFSRIFLGSLKEEVLLAEGAIQLQFSSDGQFLNLQYLGPGKPWQKVINMALWDLGSENKSFNDFPMLDTLPKLAHALERTNLPTRVHSQITLRHAGVKVNILEIFPPNFDPTAKHPLLVHVYGGPGSTTVNYNFDVDFQDIVSSRLNAVVMVIDPRGTGSDDWTSKSFAKDRLGYWEPRDVTSVAKDYITKNKYIDPELTAIWGWSYGGFTTLKTLEFDHGDIFKFGMAVAPVTNWEFYDSVYTERYMGLPKDNPNYVETAMISQYNNFKDVRRFLIMHGTSDDNVHLQNTLWLMDHFDTASVENYDVHFFPDSDHSIYYHDANDVIYDKLLLWLQRAFLGYYNEWD